jgi:hypothetical protein
MGKRGPAPEPSILKYIRGNPSKDALPTSEPTPALVQQDFPPPKALDGKCIQVWKDSVQTLSRMRVLTFGFTPGSRTIHMVCTGPVESRFGSPSMPRQAVSRRSSSALIFTAASAGIGFGLEHM